MRAAQRLFWVIVAIEVNVFGFGYLLATNRLLNTTNAVNLRISGQKKLFLIGMRFYLA